MHKMRLVCGPRFESEYGLTWVTSINVPREVGKLWLAIVPLHPSRALDLAGKVLLWSRPSRIATLVAFLPFFSFFLSPLSFTVQLFLCEIVFIDHPADE